MSARLKHPLHEIREHLLGHTDIFCSICILCSRLWSARQEATSVYRLPVEMPDTEMIAWL